MAHKLTRRISIYAETQWRRRSARTIQIIPRKTHLGADQYKPGRPYERPRPVFISLRPSASLTVHLYGKRRLFPGTEHDARITPSIVQTTSTPPPP